MKNLIDNMFLSTSPASKGLEGMISLDGGEEASEAQPFETTFRQALAAIDGVRSGKDLPKELLEFDPEKLAGMVLTEKKLSSDSSVLIGDSELSNQTVIAFAALQGMDADSLKTLFEKPLAEEVRSLDELLPDPEDTLVSDEEDSKDILSTMPPGYVEQTVRALEEQGLLPEVPKSKSPSILDEGSSKAESLLVSGSSESEELPKESSPNTSGQRPIATGDWLSLRHFNETNKFSGSGTESATEGADTDGADTDGSVAIGSQISKNSDTRNQPGPNNVGFNRSVDDQNLAAPKANLFSHRAQGLETKSNSMGTTLTNSDSLEKPIAVRALEANTKMISNRDASTESPTHAGPISAKSGTLPASTPELRQKSDQAALSTAFPDEFSEFESSRENSKSTGHSGGLNMARSVSDTPVQAQLVNSVASKPMTQHVQMPTVNTVEIASLEPLSSVSEGSSSSDSLTEPRAGTNFSRVTAEELPGKLTALVQQRIVNGLKVEGWRYQIHLHPEELGSVEIQMEMIDGRLEARILASNTAARDLLNEHLSRLEESLQSGGIKESMVQVSMDQRDGSKKPSDSGEEISEKQTQLADEAEAEAEDKRNTDGELDLFV